MTPRDLWNIHTSVKKQQGLMSMHDMVLKLPWYFYLLMEKPLLGCYYQVQCLYYQLVQCNQTTPIPVIVKVRSKKANKRTALTIIFADSFGPHFFQNFLIVLFCVFFWHGVRVLSMPKLTELYFLYQILVSPSGQKGPKLNYLHIFHTWGIRTKIKILIIK